MKQKLLLLGLMLTSAFSASAQTVVGDMDDDGNITTVDVAQVVNTALGKTAKRYINPYQTNNTSIVGTWYKSKTESITFSEDGTTSLGTGYTYKYRPNIGKVSVYNASGVSVADYDVFDISSSVLEMGLCGSSSHSFYTSAVPVQMVTGITLDKTTLYLDTEDNDSYTLTATVLPENADDTSVTWESSDEDIAMVTSKGKVVAVDLGTATITCTAKDGSGVKATCTVTVRKPDTKEAVDLGLSVKWATCNVGASSPEEYGNYFAWGETTGYNEDKTSFSWSTYTLCNGSSSTMTKYCTSSSYGTVDNKTVLESSDDAATANWGGDWRMPTDAELTELRTSCTWTWTTQSGVNGYKVTGTNGNSIFLPAAGYRDNSDLNGAGSYGVIWSSSLCSSGSNYACNVGFASGGVYRYDYNRYYGFSVRPVCQ